ncbi:MAG TPA: hypothetical protein VFG48_02010, partial [Xanthomonadales bacterium]|nr:hypothetical protein [Xanthomonadales bacterium]
WNLGHNDFAADGDSSIYMATHVWLTGLRGMVMPLVGVAFILFLESRWPGHGAYATLLPLGLTICGWGWFIRLHLELSGRQAA